MLCAEEVIERLMLDGRALGATIWEHLIVCYVINAQYLNWHYCPIARPRREP